MVVRNYFHPVEINQFINFSLKDRSFYFDHLLYLVDQDLSSISTCCRINYGVVSVKFLKFITNFKSFVYVIKEFIVSHIGKWEFYCLESRFLLSESRFLWEWRKVCVSFIFVYVGSKSMRKRNQFRGETAVSIS